MAIGSLDLISMFYGLLDFLENSFGNYTFLLIVTSAACSLKSYIAGVILFSHQATRGKKYVRTLLLATLTGFIIIDLAWILQLIQLLLEQKFILIRMFIRFSWAINSVYFLTYALFVESLAIKEHSFKKTHIPLVVISSLFAGFFIYSIIRFNFVSVTTLLWIENLHNLYSFFLLMLPSIIFTLYRLQSSSIPILLKQQAKICIYIFIIPQAILDFLQLFPFFITDGRFTNSFAIVGLSTVSLTAALCYCAQRIVGLRFLNVTDHVQSPIRIPFIDDIKNAIDQLSQATNTQDIQYVTDMFFVQTLGITMGSTKLHVRMLPEHPQTVTAKTHPTTPHIERALAEASPEFHTFMRTSRIFIYDEFEFSNFYHLDDHRSYALNMLAAINADVFIPIYKENMLLALLTIDKHSRPKGHFYSDVERDKMLVFAQYISHIVYLIQHRSFTQLLENERMLENEIYQKTQQLQHYKESLGTLLHTSKAREVGVLFYRSRRFLIGNRAAQALLGFDVGMEPKNAIAKQLKQIAEAALMHDTVQSYSYIDGDKNKIIAYATPSISQSHIIITLAYADAYDFIKDQISKLQNPHEWDYLLYLETTRSGQLINQLVPGSAKELLMFKIELLRASFGKQPLLLEMSTEDLLPAVDIIHQVGMRNKIHVLNLKEPTRPEIMAPRLFGTNPLFLLTEQLQTPLLGQLSGADTLFIQNINFLDLTSQEHLVELIKYGYYRAYKSYHKNPCSVRVIVTSSQPLEQLVQQGKFNHLLYEELHKTSLRLPWLETLSKTDVQDIAQQLSEQMFGSQRPLSDRELITLTNNCPTSIKAFKQRVEYLLKQRARQSPKTIETVYNETDDPDLNAIPRGRQALKSQKIMTLLWKKFKNQNEIASFLGVNRSSVNRRCKRFKLE